jgi:hypothetical protein
MNCEVFFNNLFEQVGITKYNGICSKETVFKMYVSNLHKTWESKDTQDKLEQIKTHIETYYGPGCYQTTFENICNF